MAVLAILSWLWAFFGIMIIFSGSLSSLSSFLLTVGVFFGPMALIRWSIVRDRNRVRSMHDKAMSSGGILVGQGFDHLEANTGIGINTAAKSLTMWNGDTCKTYSYDAVREWEASKVRMTGQAVGFGVAGAVAAGAANISAGRQADAATGLFITVKDINNAKWRISMMSEAIQARWMEILRQELKEGGIAAN